MTSTPKAKTCPTPAARQKQVWDKTAPGYDRQIAFFEKTWFTGGREWLGARARGRVLEVGIGTGRSLPCYPADVTITGIELSPAMLAIARQRASDLGRDVTLREADAEHLPFDDASFDTVTCALALCTIPSPVVAVGEMRRHRDLLAGAVHHPQPRRSGRRDAAGPRPRRAPAAPGPHWQHVAASLCRPVARRAHHDPNRRGALHPPPAASGQGRRVPGRGDRAAQGRHRRAHPRRQARLSRQHRHARQVAAFAADGPERAARRHALLLAGKRETSRTRAGGAPPLHR